jgi:hypothetical protein
VAERDVLQSLHWLLRQARKPGANSDEVKRLVESLVDRTHPEWREGEIAFQIGEVLRESGNRKDAVEYYEKAIGAFSGDVSMMAVEKFANEADRLAKEEADKGNTAEADRLAGLAEQKLESLVELAPTPERYALLGAHYKRLIQRAPTDKQAKNWIASAKENYGKAVELEHKKRTNDYYYPLLNKVQMAWLSDRSSGPLSPSQAADLLAEVEQASAAARQADLAEQTYWTSVSLVDLEFTRLLIEETLRSPKSGDTKRLLDAYGDVLETGSAGEQDSTLNNFEFLAVALRHHHETIANRILAFKKELTRRTDEGDQ